MNEEGNGNEKNGRCEYYDRPRGKRRMREKAGLVVMCAECNDSIK